MIHDATVEVTCDRDNCASSIEVNPPYVYATYGGQGGRYDTDDDTINELVEKEGWRVESDGTHTCGMCVEDEDDEDDTNQRS